MASLQGISLNAILESAFYIPGYQPQPPSSVLGEILNLNIQKIARMDSADVVDPMFGRSIQDETYGIKLKVRQGKPIFEPQRRRRAEHQQVLQHLQTTPTTNMKGLQSKKASPNIDSLQIKNKRCSSGSPSLLQRVTSSPSLYTNNKTTSSLSRTTEKEVSSSYKSNITSSNVKEINFGKVNVHKVAASARNLKESEVGPAEDVLLKNNKVAALNLRRRRHTVKERASQERIKQGNEEFYQCLACKEFKEVTKGFYPKNRSRCRECIRTIMAGRRMIETNRY